MEKDKKAIIISIILAIICIGILGYIVYFRAHKMKEEKIQNNEFNNTVNKEENKNNEEIIEESKELTLDDVLKLYNLISKYPDFRDEYVTYETLSETLKEQLVIDNLYQGDCMTNLSFTKEEFLETYKKIFNQDKINMDGSCILNTDNYDCELTCNSEFVRIINKYINYELIDNKLIIYEKAAHLDYHDDGNIYLRETIISNDVLATYNNYDEIEVELVLDKLPTYKHTFELNNENYYWLSSELVKQ